MTLKTCRDELADALGTIPKLYVHSTVPQVLGKGPRAIIDLEEVNYKLTMQDGTVLWAFRIVVLLAKSDSKKAITQLDKFLEKSGDYSIHYAVENNTIGKGAICAIANNTGYVVYRGKTWVGGEWLVGIKDGDVTTYEADNVAFRITDTGSTLRDLSKYVIEVSELPGERPVFNAESFADGGPYLLPLTERAIFTVRLKWSDDANGPDAVLGPLSRYETAVAFDFGPIGSGSGSIKYSGDCFVSNFTVNPAVGGDVECVATIEVHGTVTRGTYA